MNGLNPPVPPPPQQQQQQPPQTQQPPHPQHHHPQQQQQQQQQQHHHGPITETFNVPDQLVGLIIGKNGEVSLTAVNHRFN